MFVRPSGGGSGRPSPWSDTYVPIQDMGNYGWKFYDPKVQKAWEAHARKTLVASGRVGEAAKPLSILDENRARYWYNKNIAGPVIKPKPSASSVNAGDKVYGPPRPTTGTTGTSVASWRKAKAGKSSGGSTSGGSSGGAGSSIDTMSATEALGAAQNPLPPFGWPSKSRVSGIVNSIVAEATKNQRWANQDIEKNRVSDIGTIGAGSAAFARGTQQLRTGTQNLSDKLRAQNIAHEGIADAKTMRLRAEAEQASQQGSVPLEYAIQDAGNDAAYNLANSGIQTTNIANQSMLDFANQANMMSAQQGMSEINSAARRAIAENNRSMAEIRSRTPLTRLEVEKQLQDMHIARRIAEAQYAQAGYGIQNDQMNAIGSTIVGVEEAKAKTISAKAQARQKDMKVVHEALFGKPAKSETIAGWQPIYELDKSTGQVVQTGQKPIILEQAGVAGGPTSVAEAIQRLAALGYTGPRWANLARSAMNSLGYR